MSIAIDILTFVYRSSERVLREKWSSLRRKVGLPAMLGYDQAVDQYPEPDGPPHEERTRQQL